MSSSVQVNGAEALVKAFRELPAAMQKTVLHNSQRAAVKNLYRNVLSNVMGGVIQRNSGRLYDAMKAAKVRRLASRDKNYVRYGIELPTRAALGIPLNAKWYYPTALEYGTKERFFRVGGVAMRRGRILPRRFIRGAVDKHRAQVRRVFQEDLARGIGRYWNRQIAKRFGAIGK